MNNSAPSTHHSPLSTQHSALSTVTNRDPSVQPSALTNKRILITRAAEQANSFSQQLIALGAEPILFPTIQTAPIADNQSLDGALMRLADYDWLIFTSANSIRYFFDRLLELQTGVAVSTKRLQIACVGPKTAATLTPYALTADFVPQNFVAEEIVKGLGNLHAKKILLPQAAAARPTLAQTLETGGAQVDALAIYQTIITTPSREAFLTLKQGVDVVTFTSPSTFENFVKLSSSNWPKEAKIACIGPITAAAVARAGHQVDICPTTHTVDGLIEAMIDYFTNGLASNSSRNQS